MDAISIRRAQSGDLARLSQMCHELWPDATAAEHARDVGALVEGRGAGTMPEALFVAENEAGEAIAFLHANLRSHADGCDPSRPVGYIEGWFVEADYRRRRVGAKLINSAEQWARAQGCREMASDTWLDHEGSQRAHAALGFEEVDRCVHYRKRL